MSRCAFRPCSFAAAEAGCPLDHCICGAHVVDGDGHVDSCKLAQEERASFEAACREGADDEAHDAYHEFALTLPEGVTLRSATTLPAPADDDFPEPLSNRFFHRH